MQQQNISNERILELSARLRYQSLKDFKKYQILHKSSIASVTIGLGSIGLGVISTINHMQDFAQTSLALGLYGTLGGIGLSGVCNRNENSAFEEEEISNHIINAFICGADFSQCQNLHQVINIVGQHYINSQLSETSKDEVTSYYNHFYRNSIAYNVCENALNTTYSQSDQQEINQTTQEIYNFIFKQQALNQTCNCESNNQEIIQDNPQSL